MTGYVFSQFRFICPESQDESQTTKLLLAVKRLVTYVAE